MFIADLKGKLSLREETSEDFLTSAVFSVLLYLQDNYLRNYLNTAVNIHGQHLELDGGPSHLEFWEYFTEVKGTGHGLEPDIMLYREDELFVLEAKFYSGKSGEGFEEGEDEDVDDPKLFDQLAREYILSKILLHKPIKKGDLMCQPNSSGLIYITNHGIIPKEDIYDTATTLSNYGNYNQKHVLKDIYWTNWSNVVPILREATKDNNVPPAIRMIIADLLMFLKRRNISYFSGFLELEEMDMDLDYDSRYIFFPEKLRNLWTHRVYSKKMRTILKTFFFRSDIHINWDFLNKFDTIILQKTLFYKGADGR